MPESVCRFHVGGSVLRARRKIAARRADGFLFNRVFVNCFAPCISGVKGRSYERVCDVGRVSFCGERECMVLL